MTTPQRRKGSTWELDICKYLQSLGIAAQRIYGAGRQDDRGDIHAYRGVVLEAKACVKIDLATWTKEAEIERQNDGADYGIVIAKRRNKPTADAYAVLPLSQLARLLQEAGR